MKEPSSLAEVAAGLATRPHLWPFVPVAVGVGAATWFIVAGLAGLGVVGGLLTSRRP